MPFEMFPLLYETTHQLSNNGACFFEGLQLVTSNKLFNFTFGKKLRGVSTKQQKVAMDKVYNRKINCKTHYHQMEGHSALSSLTYSNAEQVLLGMFYST
jgi:hypothetical protein